MPIYSYKGFTSGGGTKIGVIDADTPKDARSKLRRENIYVLEIETAAGTGVVPAGMAGGQTPTKVPLIKRLRTLTGGATAMTRKRLDEVANVTRQMSTLLGAGIPLTETLKAIVEQAQSKELSMTFRDIREKVSQGATFGDALAFHPQYFNELYVNMVRAGEAAGNLDVVLGRLADFVQKQRKLRDKVSAAMTYPMVMVIVATLVVSILMTVVVPKITQSLIQQRKAIPLPTVILIALSDFMKNYWWVMCLGLAAMITAFGRIYATKKGRLAIDKFMLRVPVFGDLLKKQAIARFSTTFSTLLKSGVPVVQCLEISGRIVNNRVLQAVIEDVRAKILEGADIATPIKRSGVFPPVVGYMIAVGEQSGQLETILDRISENYDEEIDLATQRATAILEPLLIVGMAIIVGGIIFAIILPILQMGDIGGV
ncbi:MAG: type II secretion system F family protein [Planctomycetes bacterium]|nr:type II secretion system F family protein [Planctomycetota bacterium]